MRLLGRKLAGDAKLLICSCRSEFEADSNTPTPWRSCRPGMKRQREPLSARCPAISAVALRS